MSRCNTRSITPPAGKLSLSSGQMLISTTRQQGELVDSLQLCIFQLRSVELQGPYLYLPFVGLPRLRGCGRPLAGLANPGSRRNTTHLAGGGRRRAAGKKGVQPQNTLPAPVQSDPLLWAVGQHHGGHVKRNSIGGRSVMRNCISPFVH